MSPITKIMSSCSSILRLPLLVSLLALCAACDNTAGQQTSEQGETRKSWSKSEILALNKDTSPVTATIAGYSPRGIGSILGTGQARVIRKAFPGSNIVYEPGNPAGSIVKLSEGKFDFALNGTLELSIARNARGPFDRPYGNGLMAVTALAPQSSKVHVYGRAAFLDKYNIRSLADIAERQIAVNVGINQPGNIWVAAVIDAVLAEFGFTLEDIEDWGGALFSDQDAGMHDLMKDRRLDIVFAGAYAPDGRLVELNRSTPLRFLPFTPKESRSIATRLEVETTIIPPNVYAFQPEELHVPVSSHMIVAGQHAPFSSAYKFAKSLVENFDIYQATHPALRRLTVNDAVPTGLGLPIHPGAAAYYREAGLLED